MILPVVYIAHPVSGDVEANLASAARWVRWAAVRMGVAPVAPYITFCAVLDDDDEADRALGMRCDLAILRKCDEVWLCGERVSEGMAGERDHAHANGIRVYRFTAMVAACVPVRPPEPPDA